MAPTKLPGPWNEGVEARVVDGGDGAHHFAFDERENILR